MNATVRADLDTQPIPTDAAGNLARCCAIREAGESADGMADRHPQASLRPGLSDCPGSG